MAETIEAEPQTRTETLSEAPRAALPVTAEPQGMHSLLVLIDRAANNPDIDLEKMQQLLDLKEKWERGEAKKAYHAAMAAFKQDPPTLTKNKHVKIAHKDGKGFTEYDHATLDHCVALIVPALAKAGLSHGWSVDYLESGLIKVTCTLTHVLGYSESVSMQAGRDTSGSKNNLQEQASTSTYLSRYTLLLITGLAAKDQDDDGEAGGGDPEYENSRDKVLRISEAQKDTLIKMMADIIGPDEKQTRRFLDALEIPSIDQLPGPEFDNAVARLKRYEENKKARQQ